MLKMPQTLDYAVIQQGFNINSILQELDYAIDQRCYGEEKYLVHDIEEPLNANEFYSLIKFEIQDVLRRIINDNDFMRKQLREFPTQADYVESLVDGFARESAHGVLR
ncbi:MAG: hypothetical protein FWE44_07395 [Defluviitaleaceae bacterium]|nr:hypothetical protein [Defluviitaleaceae bacterium]